MYTLQTDVLVVGGGASGAMAAYEASKYSANVMMVIKGRPHRHGNTVMAPGAIGGVGDWGLPADSRDTHFKDTVEGGSFMAEQTLVRILVEESPELIVELERIGAIWQREAMGKTYEYEANVVPPLPRHSERVGDDVTYQLRIDGGHSYHRCPFLEDRTGREMLRTLHGEINKRNVRIFKEIMILELLKEDGKCTGAIGLDLKSGNTVMIRAKAVILACGGAGNMYKRTDNPLGCTGDGHALALEAGATMMDMEFVQFFPTAFTYPDSLSGALGALLYYIELKNKDGERFMTKYDADRMELSTRDRVSRAIMTEVREGRGGPHGGVFADMTFHEPGFIAKYTPALFQTYTKIGVNPEKDMLEVLPTCHFLMGGVKMNTEWSSTLPGLFTAGENGCGIQGANRLSQNALAELIVSGNRAGKSAAKYVEGVKLSSGQPGLTKKIESKVNGLMSNTGGVRPVALRKALQEMMWNDVGVFRSKESLERAAKELDRLEALLPQQTLSQRSLHYNQELQEALENEFLITVAKCTLKGATLRTESRGAHFREDYPDTDNKNWLEHILINKEGGELKISKCPVDLKEMRPKE